MATSKIKYGGIFSGKSGFPEKKVKTRVIDYGSDIKNVEKDSITELTELQKEFREAAKKEEQLKEENTNTEFFSVLVFKTQAQRDEFYSLLGIQSEDLQYIDGQKLIQALELNIRKLDIRNPGKFKCNVEIANLAFK